MFSKWLRISLFNLMLVAFLGMILRYKILFSLPFLDQKHLLHAHSHFAFSGWVGIWRVAGTCQRADKRRAGWRVDWLASLGQAVQSQDT